MPVFAVTYTYDDREDRRAEVRPAHRAWLAGLVDEGVVLASGPFEDGAPGALILVRADDRQDVEELLAKDPFAEIVASRSVRQWSPVFGPWAAPAG